MISLGNIPAGSTFYFPFDTYDANMASVTISGLAVTDIEIYKDGSVTQRASDNGYALLDTDGIDFDGATGLHGFSVDFSDNSDAGFYAAGHVYWVNVNSITVNAQTVRFTYSFRLIAAENTAGTPVVDVGRINNVSASSVTAVNANVGTTQPTNFTGTGASALVKSDVQDYLGSAAPALQGGRFDASVGAYQTGLTPLQPTVAGRTLDVTATGEAGLDWANIGSPTTTVNLSGTSTKAVEPTVAGRTLDVAVTGEAGLDFDNIHDATGAHTLTNIRVPNVTLTDTVTTYTGNTPQTGDTFALANGASGFAAIKTDTGNLVTRITATLFSGITSLAQWLGLIAGKQVGDATARTEMRATGAGSGTYDETTDSQQAIRDESVTLLGNLQADTDDIQTRIPAALSAGGMMMSDVEEVLGTPAQPTGITPRKNTALANFEFPMFDAADGKTLKTGLTITATRSLDGGAFAACTNAATEVGTTGVYKINLSAADMNADTITLMFDGGPTANVAIFTVVTQP